MPLSSSQFASQPGLSQSPIAHYRIRRNVQYFGRFVDSQTAKKAQLHHAGFSWFEFRESSERVVDRQQVAILPGGEAEVVVECDAKHAAVSLGSRTRARRIHQNPPHHLGRY